MREFTQLWWESNQPIFEYIDKLIFLEPNNRPPLLGIEIGSFEGQSACWFLEQWLPHSESRLICIDTWQGGVEHQTDEYNFNEIEQRFDRNVSDYKHKIVKIKQPSNQALIHLANMKVFADFVYIDGGHSSSDVLQDLVLAHQITKSGGLVVCDDYLWHSSTQDFLEQPKLAIDAFTNCMYKQIQLLNLPSKIVAWIKK